MLKPCIQELLSQYGVVYLTLRFLLAELPSDNLGDPIGASVIQ